MQRWIIPLLYFASSTAALVYELTWMRMLGARLGVAFVATAIVLAAYMGGLGLGSALAGRWAHAVRRPLLIYGCVELALAGYAHLMPRILATPSEALALAALVIPSTLIGGTYPLLVRAMAVAADHLGEVGGRLYAVGTAGGVLGVLGTALGLLPALGVTGAMAAGAAVGAGCGCVALLAVLMGWGGVERPASEARQHAPLTLAQRRAVAIVALSGLAAMIYELVWFRSLRLITADTSRAVGCVLAAFLIGIALGAEISARWAHRRRFRWLAGVQVAVALYALLSPHLLRVLDGASLVEGTLAELLGAALLLMLLPATMLGATFPIALSVFDEGRIGHAASAGSIYAASTFGAIAGVVLGAFVVPHLGARAALLVGAAASASAGWVAIRGMRPSATRIDRALRWSHAPLTFAAAVLLLWRGEVFFTPPDGAVVARVEDASGVVHVMRDASGVLHLHANRNHRWGSSAPRMVEAMRAQGALPLMLHPSPARLVEIGLGTGVQLQPALADERVRHIDVVELSPAIATGAEHFAQHNGGLLSHPKAELTIADGHHFLQSATATWDVIVLGLFTPYRPGAGQLFSRELYAACRERLAAGGLIVHWLPLAQLSPAALRSVVRTFVSVFPDAHAWQRAQYLALVSGDDLPARMSQIDRHEIFGWLASYAMGPEALARWSEGAALNTRAFPVVELGEARAGVATMLENMEAILARRAPPVVPLPPSVSSTVARAHQARGHALRSVMAQARGNESTSLAELRRAAELNPGDEIVQAELGRLLGK